MMMHKVYPMIRRSLISCSIVLLTGLFPGILHAKVNTSVKSTLVRLENGDQETRTSLIVPYGFSTDSMGVTLGVGGGAKGYGQDQLVLGATAFASFEEAVGMFVGMWDYRPPFTERIFFTALGMVGHYPQQRAYSARYFQPGVPRPGSNDSDKSQYAEDSGLDNWTDFRLEYVLPMGSARSDALQHYRIQGGMLQSPPAGGKTWNPLKSGVTTVLLRQYNEYRSFEFPGGDVDVTIHPVQLAVSYDNTDYPNNPSMGSAQYLAVTHDFGWFESPDDWTFIEFEASKYFSLGPSDWAKQRIIAINFWTGDTPTWEEETDTAGVTTIKHNAPFYDGATLGGFYRMRGYPVDRFNDRSVMYAAAEYRYTLDWNPLGEVSWLSFLQSDWLQLVGFVEGGRVANEYGDLFEEWKVDGGVGIRAMFAGAVVRLDVGVSDETTSAWAMFGHPF
jgi:hypothetical protein